MPGESVIAASDFVVFDIGRRDAEKGEETPADRLRRLRVARGFSRPEHFSRTLPDVKVNTYYQHETGWRAVSPRTAQVYAPALGVDPGYLLFGTQLSVPVTGIVALGGLIIAPLDGDTRLVARPPVEEATVIAALEVVESALWPAYSAGDCVYYDQAALDRPVDLRRVVGRECVVIAGGQRKIRTVTMASDGSVVLVSHVHAPEPNVQLVAAAPVLWIRKA